MDHSELNRMLKDAHAAMDVGDVLRLAAAAAAAPEGRDPAAWTRLVVPDPAPDLREKLDSLRRKAVETREDGLDGAPPHSVLRTRLDAIRDAMTARGFDGFLIPRADPHQGEVTPRRDQRLVWATGFTGSAGMAILLRERCVLFVDGRYGLQARMEVDGESVEIAALQGGGPALWLKTQAPPGARIAYDPWLHPPAGLDSLAEACEAAGARLEAAGDNPIDAAWAGQAERPVAPVRMHAETHAGESAGEKRNRLGDALGEEGVAAAVLTDPAAIAWLLNIRGADLPHTPVALAFALLHADGRVALFTDPAKFAPVRAPLGDGVSIEEWDAFGPALDMLAGEAVRIDPDTAPDWVFQRLAAAEAQAVHGHDVCAMPKAVKNAAEIAGMRACHRRDGAALCRFLAWLDAEGRNDVMESAAAAQLEAFRRDDPLFLSPSFSTIAGSGPNGAIVHYRVTAATDRALRAGELFLLDSGGQYVDGTTDVTRTVAIGAPDADQRAAFTRVLRGHIALATLIFPAGATGGQIDAIARAPLWAAGLDFDHGTGHGVGAALSVHEGPARIAKAAKGPALAAGMILSNEPGYYREGAFGVRIENLELVVEASLPDPAPDARPSLGFEALTLAPIDRRLIEPALLTREEMDWLDAYHRRVRDLIGPELERIDDHRALRWLDDATAPLMSWWGRPAPV